MILGMHRCGTSALARVLNLAGVELGDQVLGAHSCNRSGLWEHRAIVEANETILQSAGSSWFDVRPLPVGLRESAWDAATEQRIGAVLRDDFGDKPCWGLKDPRISLLLPLYRRVMASLSVAPLAIQMYRSPAEVAASLYKRDGIPRDVAGMLWLKYNLNAERDTRDLPRSFVAYADLIDNWREVLERIGRDVELDWQLDSAAQQAIDTFLDPGQHHQNSGGNWWSGEGDIAEMLGRARELLESTRNTDTQPAKWDALGKDFDGWIAARTRSLYQDECSGRRQPIDVIVPVYKGLKQTTHCLESLRKAANITPYEIIVVNDASPEPELAARLEDMASDLRISLFDNDKNIGFAATVNRAVALHPLRDVVLLNSDTEVANDWLDRMVSCANREQSTGTVTPFSNNATICGYPGYCRESELPVGWKTSDLDVVVAAANQGQAAKIPTAVGFCMYIKRACWNTVDGFDVQAFGRGYGEENDFCFKATALGWDHLLAADVFVYHEGGVSFSDISEKQQAAEEVLTRRYPGYPAIIRDFIARDSLRAFRERIDRRRMDSRGDAEARVIVAEKEAQNNFIMKTLQASYQLSSDLNAEIVRLSNEGNEMRALYTQAEQFVRERERDIHRLEQSVKRVQDSAEELKGFLKDRERDVRELRDALSEHQQALEQRESDLRNVLLERDDLAENRSHLQMELARTRVELDQLRAELARTNSELGRVYGSRSWKITAPLRRAQAIVQASRSRRIDVNKKN